MCPAFDAVIHGSLTLTVSGCTRCTGTLTEGLPALERTDWLVALVPSHDLSCVVISFMDASDQEVGISVLEGLIGPGRQPGEPQFLLRTLKLIHSKRRSEAPPKRTKRYVSKRSGRAKRKEAPKYATAPTATQENITPTVGTSLIEERHQAPATSMPNVAARI